MQIHLLKPWGGRTAGARLFAYEHYLIYHGDAVRPEDTGGFYSVHRLPTSKRASLHIVRSGKYVPEIFDPLGPSSLVVSKRIREQLADMQGIDFLPVVFDKLVDRELNLDDDSIGRRFMEEADHARFEEWVLTGEPDVPECHETIGQYYELIGAFDHEVIDELACRTVPVALDVQPRDEDDDEDEDLRAELSYEMFLRYPLILGPRLIWMCRSDLYEVLRTGIDQTFFAKGSAWIAH